MTKLVVPLVFVPQPSSSQSQREKELLSAERLSHAARVSHARRRRVTGIGEVKQSRSRRTTKPDATSAGNKEVAVLSRRGDLERPEHTQTEIMAVPHVTPLCSTLHGSSDPFGCFPVAVTPQVSQVLGYASQSLLSLFATPYARRLFSGPMHEYWNPRDAKILEQRFVSFSWTWEWSSAEEGSLSSYVSMYALSLMRLLPKDRHKEYSVLALSLRTTSLEVLRKRVSRLCGNERPDMALIMTVLRLFRMDAFAGDVGAARIHARMIRHFAESIPEIDRRSHFIRMTVYNDIVSATLYLRQPLLDYTAWIPDFLNDCRLRIDQFLTPEESVDRSIHQTINLPQLLQVLKRLRWYLFLAEQTIFMPESLKWEAELIYRYILTSAQQNQATLLDLYVRLSRDNDPQLRPRLINTALSLTLMLCLQKSIWEADRNGVDICDSSQTIMPKLEGLLQLSLETSTLQELDYYKETHFWMYFVAAQLEWKTSPNLAALPVKIQPQKQNPWFSIMLAQQAQFLELRKWPDAQAVLDLFVINEFWEPHPSMWYERVVQEFSDPTLAPKLEVD